MIRLRQATCDTCDSRIDRLYTGSVNPVICYQCMKKMIQWLHEIDCLDNHVFGSLIALAVGDDLGEDDEGNQRIRVWLESKHVQYGMRELYVRIHSFVQENA